MLLHTAKVLFKGFIQILSTHCAHWIADWSWNSASFDCFINYYIHMEKLTRIANWFTPLWQLYFFQSSVFYFSFALKVIKPRYSCNLYLEKSYFKTLLILYQILNYHPPEREPMLIDEIFWNIKMAKKSRLTLHLKLIIVHQFTLVAIGQIRILFYLVSCAVMRFVGQAWVKRLGVSIERTRRHDLLRRLEMTKINSKLSLLQFLTLFWWEKWKVLGKISVSTAELLWLASSFLG